ALTCPGNTSGRSIATSYNYTIRQQEIDLLELGFPEEFLDACPDITVSDWGLSSIKCPGVLTLKITLLDKNKKVIEQYDSGIVNCPTDRWLEVRYTFKNYKKGVREIIYSDIGTETRKWSGW